MDALQHLLVYLSLGLAVAYLAWKYALPYKFKKASKSSSGPCDQDNCACH